MKHCLKKIFAASFAIALLISALTVMTPVNSAEAAEEPVIAVKTWIVGDSSTLTEVGQTKKLVGYISPANVTNKQARWRSSDESIVTVDKNGVVTAVGDGTALIILETVDGGAIGTYEVKVKIGGEPEPAPEIKPADPVENDPEVKDETKEEEPKPETKPEEGKTDIKTEEPKPETKPEEVKEETKPVTTPKAEKPEEQKDSNPKTGDSKNLTLPIAVMAVICGIGLTGAYVVKRNKSN